MWTLAGRRLRVENLKLKEQEKDNAETQSAQRFRREVWVAGTSWRAGNMRNGSTDSDYCQGISTIFKSFELRRRKSRDRKELAGIM